MLPSFIRRVAVEGIRRQWARRRDHSNAAAGGQCCDGGPEKFIISPASAPIRSLPLYAGCLPGRFGLLPINSFTRFLARPEFKTLRELRSKRLAVGGLGDTTEVSLRIGLEAAGKNPKDYVILGVGNPNIMSALESGNVEAALLNPPLLYYAKRKGFREVLDVGAHVKMPLGGLTTMASTIQNRPAEIRRLIRAMQIAKRSMLQSKEKSVDVMIRFLKSTEKPRKRHLQIIKRP